jgi:hypothetical protein
MERILKNERLWDWTWFLVWGIASSVWCITAAGQLSATFDEPIDLSRAMEWWRNGTHRPLLRVGAMPLPMDVETFPLYLWERWHGIKLDLLDADIGKALPWARAGTLVFWWVLLVYGRLAGRQLAGPWGGRLAVAILACEPSMLAHACLATKDIAVSACLLALVYHFRSQREATWRRRVGWPAFWYGAAILAKASGLVFGPLCLLAVEIERLIREKGLPLWPRVRTDQGTSERGRIRPWLSDLWTQLRPFRSDLTQVIALGLLVAFVYCGSDWQAESTFVAWARGLPDGQFARGTVWIAENLRIFSNAGEGLIKQVTHNIRGHGAYLLGQTDPRALWYYYPLVLTIKLSLVVLVTPVVLALLRPRALANWACVAAAALVLFSLTCRVQLGIRLMLPLAALGIVGLAAAIVESVRATRTKWAKGLLAAGAVAGIALSVAADAKAWPDTIRYINDLWGGTAEGYRLVSDANYDWGQGLNDLRRWQKRNGLASVDLWYFGADPSGSKPPFHPVALHSPSIAGPTDVQAQVRGHVLAASTTLVYGCPINESHRQAAAFLRDRKPSARTRTFLIYDFREDTADASNPSKNLTSAKVRTPPVGQLLSRPLDAAR